MTSPSEILVMGAGMVGVSTALALQERGHHVTLVDKREPGLETSFGNAGIIQAEAVEPYALPHSLTKLARFAFQRDNAVRYQFNALPSQAWPLWIYFLNSAPKRHLVFSQRYSALIKQAIGSHAPWIEASKAEGLIRTTGYRSILRSERALELELRNCERLMCDYGIAAKVMSGVELAAAEPGFAKTLAGAVHWTESWSCNDPGGLVAAYAKLFMDRGGKFVRADAGTLTETHNGWRIAAEGRTMTAAHAVVALGPWSPAFLRRFSYHIPMVLKRGYHRHYATKAAFTMPHYDVERSYLLCPMRAGLRLTTGAELARLGAPLTPVQLQRAEMSAKEILNLGPALEADPWTGVRPCMPDMLPVIGRMPRHKTLWANFGHGHQGFTLGPVTALRLADSIDRSSDIPHSFDPARLLGI